MALFTAIATAIGTAIGLAGTALTVFTAIGATVLSIGVSSLLIKRLTPNVDAGGPGGGRVQIPPATDNKIPVVYGSAYVGGPVIDAKISTDLRTMWYVVALAEHTDTTAGSGYTFDTNNIYYDGKRVQFASSTSPNVTGLINNTPGGTEIDTKVNGKIFIYLFTNGSSSGVNTSGQSAIQILQDSQIPVGQRWTSTDVMTNCCFAIVRVNYDDKAGTTNLGGLLCKITNSLDKPGSVIKDYLLNTRYGCAVPLSRIDTASLTALDTYSDQMIVYGPNPGDTQARYRINGPVSTGSPCLDNLNRLADSCDTWLQYSELTAQWSVVINKPYSGTLTNLFLVDSSNLVGGINIAPINLNETYNELEVAYPNQYIKDQTDYQVIELVDYEPGIMSPNEAINRLNVSYPYVNNSVQALYLGVRKLLQSREDLTITMRLDYSGIQVDAGDVIRVKHDGYGWDVLNSGEGKLFRVASVAEEKYQDGSLGVFISAFEYNGTIYDDRALLNFEPDPNTGLTDPNIIDQPDAPLVTVNDFNTLKQMFVYGNVPDVGLIRYLDFNYGFDSNVSNHFYYTTITNSNGAPLINSNSNANTYNTYLVQVSDIPINNGNGNIYWSVTAKNDQVGRTSNASTVVNWGGSNVSIANNNAYIFCNATSSGNLITTDPMPSSWFYTGSNALGVPVGNVFQGLLKSVPLQVKSGTGTFAANTYITNFISNTQFTVNNIPTVALSNACWGFSNVGGIYGNNVQSNTIASNNLVDSGVTAGTYTNSTITVNNKGIVTYAANGSGGNISVLDEGNLITNAVSSFNFQGSGVTVTSGGGNSVVVTVSGGNTSANVWTLEAYDSVEPGTSLTPFGNVANYVYRNQTLTYPGAIEMYWDSGNGNMRARSYTQTANDWYPWYQNTATTANGFLANSTSSYNPANARYQNMTVFNGSTAQSPLDGLNGWWLLGQSQVAANAVANSQFQYTGVFNLVANANCTIQVGGSTRYVTDALVEKGFIVDWGTVTTYTMVENRPQTVYINFKTNGTQIANNYETFAMGGVIKVPDANVNIKLATGQWLITEPINWSWSP